MQILPAFLGQQEVKAMVIWIPTLCALVTPNRAYNGYLSSMKNISVQAKRFIKAEFRLL
jgi:hypothetical protein